VILLKVGLMNGAPHEEWATECLALAKKLGVGLEVEPNGITMSIFASDTVPEIVARYRMIARRPGSSRGDP
jgi:hypothetical protein